MADTETYKSTVINMVTVSNFKIISEKFNMMPNYAHKGIINYININL